jgi:hypothetical protein
LANLAVTNAKLADGAVSQAKMAVNSVGTSQVVDGSITSAKLASGVLSSLPFKYAYCKVDYKGDVLWPSCYNVNRVSKGSTGYFYVYFETPFTSMPAIMLQEIYGDNTDCTVSDQSTTAITVYCQRYTGSSYDINFNVFVIGP